MASAVKTQIVSFTNSNTCPITDSNETAVQTAINSYYSNKYDTEPDIFSFSFPGFSGQFIFDNSATPVIHLIPWQDIKVTYNYHTGLGFLSFTITTHDGVQYIFVQTSTETRTTTYMGGGYVNVLKRDNLLYSGGVTYPTEWKHTQILSPSGGNITLFLYHAEHGTGGYYWFNGAQCATGNYVHQRHGIHRLADGVTGADCKHGWGFQEAMYQSVRVQYSSVIPGPVRLANYSV